MGRSLSEQFMPNYLTSIISFLVSLLTGLFLTSFYTDKLGLAAYGLIPLATSVTEYIVIISSSMSSAISRFITVSMSSGNRDEAISVFSTSKYGIWAIALALLPVAIIISFIAPSFFSIPSTCSNNEVAVMFLGVIGASLLTTAAIPNSSIIYAKNRLDVQNSIIILTTLLRVGLIVGALLFFEPNLTYVGLFTFVASVVYYFSFAILSRRSEPLIRADIKKVSRSMFKKLGNLGGWNIINGIGGLLFIQMSLIMTNLFLGAEAGGELSILMLIVTALITFASTLTNLFTPVTYMLYSEGKIDEMLSNVYSAMKVSAVLLSVCASVIIALGPQIMNVWMGMEYEYLSNYLFLVLIIVIVTGVASPKWALSSAYLKPGRFGISTLATGALNIILVFIFVNVFGFGINGVIYALTISYVVKDSIINPYLYTTIVERSWYYFYAPTLFGFVSYGIFVIISYFIVKWIEVPYSLLWVIIVSGILFIAEATLAIKFFLSKEDKSKIQSCVPSFLNNRLVSWFLQ